MTIYVTMRQLQREGGKLINSLSENDKMILTSKGEPIAEVLKSKKKKERISTKVVDFRKFAGISKGVDRKDIKNLYSYD